MKRRVLLPSFVAGVAALGAIGVIGLMSKNDSYADENSIEYIANKHNMSVEATQESIAAKTLMVKARSSEVFDALGIAKYKHLAGNFYNVYFDSEEETIRGYNALSEVAERVSLSYKTNVEDYDGDIEYKRISYDSGEWHWWGLDKTNILNYDGVTDPQVQVVVGVIDSGFDSNHDSLYARHALVGDDGSSDCWVASDGPDFCNGFNESDAEHGTSTAGLIANATPNNVLVELATGNGYSTGIMELLATLKESGVHVVNMSTGFTTGSEEDRDGYNEILKEYRDSGLIMVGAVGNDNTQVENDLMFPACSPYVITVGASNEGDDVTQFSSYGDRLDFLAPGDNVTAPMPNNVKDDCDNDCYVLHTAGTSYSAPLVSAIIAKLLTVRPDYNYFDVYSYLRINAKNLYDDGFDGSSGYGRVYMGENYDVGPNYYVNGNEIDMELVSYNEAKTAITASAWAGNNRLVTEYKLVEGADVDNVPQSGYVYLNARNSLEQTVDITPDTDYTLWFANQDGAVMGVSFHSEPAPTQDNGDQNEGEGSGNTGDNTGGNTDDGGNSGDSGSGSSDDGGDPDDNGNSGNSGNSGDGDNSGNGDNPGDGDNSGGNSNNDDSNDTPTNSETDNEPNANSGKQDSTVDSKTAESGGSNSLATNPNTSNGKYGSAAHLSMTGGAVLLALGLIRFKTRR